MKKYGSWKPRNRRFTTDNYSSIRFPPSSVLRLPAASSFFLLTSNFQSPPMRPLARPVLVSLIFPAVTFLGRAQPPAIQPATPAGGDASLEYIAAESARLNQSDRSAQTAQLAQQLQILKRERAELRRQLQAKQEEQARLGANSAQYGQLGADITSLNSQIAALEMQIQEITFRLQSPPPPAVPSPTHVIVPEQVAVHPPAPSGSKNAKRPGVLSVPVIPRDQINAAAARFSGQPAPTADDARQAAAQIVHAQPASAGSYNTEEIALLVMQKAEQDNEADLRALLAELKQKNDQKAAQRASTPDAQPDPANPNDLSPEDRRRLLAISDRQTKLEHAIIELAHVPGK